MLIPALLFAGGAIVLAWSSTLLVTSLTAIAGILKISQFTVGFLLMAVATSFPELVVGITSARQGAPLLSLGNVIGSNIANLTLIAGVAAVANDGIRVQSSVRKRDLVYMAIISFAPLILLYDQKLSRNDGVLLILLYLLYIYRLFHQRLEYSKQLNHNRRRGRKELLVNAAKFATGALLLLGGADVMVRSAQHLAAGWGISLTIIGLFLVALGTSLPELSFEIGAIAERRSTMVLGTLLGSVVVNASLILGITALIHPIQIASWSTYISSGIAMVLVVLIFSTFVRSRSKLSLGEGLSLIFLYLIFTFIELNL